jgi:hypothetical protein
LLELALRLYFLKYLAPPSSPLVSGGVIRLREIIMTAKDLPSDGFDFYK